MDKFEISAARRLYRWQPDASGAVLIGSPFSPLKYAAQALNEHRVPYVVDIGDPWVLTNPRPEGIALQRLRSSRAERLVWSSARGVIVTTKKQGEDLSYLFPHLSVLVRPNGYDPAPAVTPVVCPPDDELRLVHYGSLYGARVDFVGIFNALVASDRWRHIRLTQYGSDWEGLLNHLPPRVTVKRHAPIPWDEVVRQTYEHHAAIVIGWADPGRMPSKTVQYLTLPTPRIAFANDVAGDALSDYVVGERSWLTIAPTDHDIAGKLERHLNTVWSTTDFAPPEGESWPAIESQLRDFIVRTTA